MPAKHLKLIHDYLENHPLKRPINYTIPDYWNYVKLDSKKVLGHEEMIQPVSFFKSLIKEVYLNKQTQDPSKPLSFTLKENHKPGDWLKESSIYSAMVRTTAAWDSDRSGELEDANIDGLKETGTFLKMLILLPRLKAMGIDTLYLLPITEYSLKDKKGELGSPYGIKDIFKLDPHLSDPLVDEAIDINAQFAALVEACHILGIRVMIDIIPRTNAVDSAFIKEHPDWFYWIKKEAYNEYFPPSVDGIPPVTQPRKEDFKLLYGSENVKKHLSYFSLDPKSLDAKKWDKIKNDVPLVDAIEKHYNLKIAPAFSDHINDPQPPWTDITFFRLYLDHPKEALPYIYKDQPPYILFDTIKSNLYPGKKPNMPLWETLADIIPYFQRTFGIDGARIDMGHALPKELLELIIKKARENDPDFGFIAEELSPKYAKEARENGYNLIISNGFMMQPKVFEGKSKEFFMTSKDLPLPVFASAETHDTPRTASREGGRILANTLTLLNYFMPNGVFFMNTGLEVYEPQPMNTGLDNSEGATKKLPKDDPYYGKLALFDRYQLHYLHPQRFDIYNMLSFLNPLKKKYQKALSNPKKTTFIKHDHPFFLGYVATLKNKPFKGLMVLSNLNPYSDAYLNLDLKDLLPNSLEAELVFATHEDPRPFNQIHEGLCDIHLGPGEVKLIEIT